MTNNYSQVLIDSTDRLAVYHGDHVAPGSP